MSQKQTREQKMLSFYRIAVNNAVRNLMKVLETGNEAQWGADSHETLLRKAAVRLQEEVDAPKIEEETLPLDHA